MRAAPYIYNDTEFIPGITPVYYSGPYWDNREIEAAIGALIHGKWLTAGEAVDEFEKAFSKRFNAGYSLMVNSGSSANLVMMAALKKYYKWPDGAEIIVSPAGFATTISVIWQNRMKPVFADIEWDTLNFDLQKVVDKLSYKTAAIFLSPVLGNPPDIDTLVTICEERGIKLVLDNCDSLGTKWKGKYLNEYAVASSNSFYPAHHISTGEGGMVCTQIKELHHLMRSIAWWGRDCYCVGANNLKPDGVCGRRFDKWLDTYTGIVDHKYVFSTLGYNLKPLDLQGAIGLVQLEKFTEIDARRKWAKAAIEQVVLEALPEVKEIKSLPEADVSWFGTPFIYDRKHELVAHLEKNKIQTRNYFAGNILFHPGYAFMGDSRDYPEANKVLDRVFFLGCSPYYNNDTIMYIEDIVKKFA